jgi:hypothetical protein
VGPLCHVLTAVLDRVTVQLEVVGRVAPGELDQLGDDFAAYLGAFVGHTATVSTIERVF